MRKQHWTIALVVAFAGLGAACGDDNVDVMPLPDAGPRDSGAPGTDTGPAPEIDSGPGVDAGPSGCPAADARDLVTVPAGDLTADTTWTCDHTYRLGGEVFVRNPADGVTTLTIEPGTIVEGDAAAGGVAALVITTSGRIMADGTPADPIVFTSSKSPAERAPGDWGGVVLLGRAVANYPGGGTSTIEGIDPTDMRAAFGGSDDAWSCGTLRYVQIQYAGYEFAVDKELNGLSVGACGSGTTLDYIQVHMGSDDGVELWGGTTNVRHLLVTGAGDDGFDWDNGWRGHAQFVIVQQHAGVGDNGIEADNNDPALDGTFMLTPRTEPIVYNATFIGVPDADGSSAAGVRLRRGTGAHLNNIIVWGFKRSCIRADLDVGDAQIASHTTELHASVLDDCGPAPDMSVYVEDLGTEWLMPAYMNQTGVDPMLADPRNETAPNFVPAAGSPVATGAATPPEDMDMTATYIGAVEPGAATPWYAGWTAFP